ncbi:NAD(P)H-dependent glycerol-3-phosphate dehydrogenase [Actinobacillus equuli]|nr:NAD(P)H-dependent glycerol-3-phosphate dehydrogenase [Actinobacillus equuli]
MSEMYSAPVTVLGAGSYGTALAIALARNGHKTYLWGHRPEKMAILAAERMNNAFYRVLLFLMLWKLKVI